MCSVVYSLEFVECYWILVPILTCLGFNVRHIYRTQADVFRDVCDWNENCISRLATDFFLISRVVNGLCFTKCGVIIYRIDQQELDIISMV